MGTTWLREAGEEARGATFLLHQLGDPPLPRAAQLVRQDGDTPQVQRRRPVPRALRSQGNPCL